MGTADVDGEDEEPHGHLGARVEGGEGRHVRVQGADQREHDHEELEQRHGHNHEVDGGGVNLLVDLALVVSEG